MLAPYWCLLEKLCTHIASTKPKTIFFIAYYGHWWITPVTNNNMPCTIHSLILTGAVLVSSDSTTAPSEMSPGWEVSTGACMEQVSRKKFRIAYRSTVLLHCAVSNIVHACVLHQGNYNSIFRRNISIKFKCLWLFDNHTWCQQWQYDIHKYIASYLPESCRCH